MKTKFAGLCFVIGALMVPVIGYTADSDTDRSHPKTYVKDSVITTKVKAKLAEEKVSSLVHIRVDTDSKGVVWLSGTADSQESVDKAVSIAHDTEGVSSVVNHIKVKKSD